MKAIIIPYLNGWFVCTIATRKSINRQLQSDSRWRQNTAAEEKCEHTADERRQITAVERLLVTFRNVENQATAQTIEYLHQIQTLPTASNSKFLFLCHPDSQHLRKERVTQSAHHNGHNPPPNQQPSHS